MSIRRPKRNSGFSHYSRIAIGVAVLLLLMVITALSISGLAQHQEIAVSQATSPTPPLQATSPAKSTGVPQATSAAAAGAIQLVADGDNFRVQVQNGYLSYPSWIGSSRLLFSWVKGPADASFLPQRPMYIADFDHRQLQPVELDQFAGLDAIRPIPAPDGDLVVLLCEGRGFMPTYKVDLLDARTGKVETVLSSHKEGANWQSNTTREALFDGVFWLGATWLSQSAFAVTLIPVGSEQETPRGRYSWGKTLLVDIAARNVTLLAEQAQIAAVLPDGKLLVRSGWVDGELQLLSPPYTAPPITIAPSGPWTWGWAVSPDGTKVAWLEMIPPPSDWSRQLPRSCCDTDADPAPVPQSMVVWDSSTGQVRRFPISGFTWSREHRGLYPQYRPIWSYEEQLHWSRDSKGVLYTAQPPSTERNAIYRHFLNGDLKLLVEHDGREGLAVIAEGRDGSLYYRINGRDCPACVQLMRRDPGGRLELIHANSVPREWGIDEQGRYIVWQDGTLVIRDLSSDNTHQAMFPNIRITTEDLNDSTILYIMPISPDGNWVVYASSLLMQNEQQPTPEHQVIHIVIVRAK